MAIQIRNILQGTDKHCSFEIHGSADDCDFVERFLADAGIKTSGRKKIAKIPVYKVFAATNANTLRKVLEGDDNFAVQPPDPE